MHKKRKNAIKKQSTIPCFNVDLPLLIFSSECDSAIKGVIAVENPIPRAIAIKKKLFPRDTAANSAVPS